MTEAEIAERELIAQHADDYRAWRREMAECQRLRAKHGLIRPAPQPRGPRPVKRPTGGRVAHSKEHALQLMKEALG